MLNVAWPFVYDAEKLAGGDCVANCVTSHLASSW